MLVATSSTSWFEAYEILVEEPAPLFQLSTSTVLRERMESEYHSLSISLVIRTKLSQPLCQLQRNQVH